MTKRLLFKILAPILKIGTRMIAHSWIVPIFCAIITQFCFEDIALAQTFIALAPTQYSPRTVALDLSDVADVRDEWAPNPAMPADTSAHIRGALWPLPLGLASTNAVGFSADYPLSNSATAGASFTDYQSSNIFSWESFGLQASKTFQVGGDSSNRKAVAGVRLRYAQESFSPIYLPAEDFTADLGAEFDIASQLTLGAAVTHLIGSINEDVLIESRTGWIGLSYRPVPEAEANAAIESSENSHPDFLFGVEYALDEYILLRVGTDTPIGIISGGIGVRTDILTIDFAVARHPDLGTSISFGIGLAL
jgi:hypothetical protein